MPEIPELTILRDNLESLLTDQMLKRFLIIKPYIQKTTIPEGLQGQKIANISRTGKYINIELEKHRFIIHLMLRGRFKLLAKGAEPLKSAAAVFEFTDTSLQLIEDAKLKRMSLWIVDAKTGIGDVKSLGVDALDPGFNVKKLEEIVGDSRERLKNFLLNQRNIAGIGNAYANEICWCARLSPFKPVNKLATEDVSNLHTCIVNVLTEAIEKVRELTGARLEIAEQRPFVSVHRKKGEPCPRCGVKIEWVSANRDTFYCPRCQTGGKILKDNRTSRFLK